MAQVRFIFLLFSFGLLAACSGTYHAYKTMYEVAAKSAEDVGLTFDTVASAKYDYLYVRLAEQGRVALALRYIEQGQLKWISADNNMLITRGGRIVRTLGLDNDLIHLTNQTADPLLEPFNIAPTSTWLRLADWQQGEYGYQIRSQFVLEHGHTLSFFGHALPVIKVIETVRYDNDANFVRFDDKWQNIFWLDAKTGTVLKTVQQLQPGADVLELTFITEVARRLIALGITVNPEAI